ncbi:hypothetical protein GCM10008955_22110 [Deinococcus malanensis]|uniref:S8 family peptidase n=1 Tax=Deinococcus malanensis TaxID=1706855 RepID=A0ABQ2EV43_9DEIO|nr:S8 family peptidase [Deinococcus malanensis]GGK27907.1 hypothetical protein GCM10008955_22110 [Deinococcus malanensis]
MRLSLSVVLSLPLLLAACGTPSTSSAPVPAADEPARSVPTSAPLVGLDNPLGIDGQYIVVFSQGEPSGVISAQATSLLSQALSAQDHDGLIRMLGLSEQGVSIRHLYAGTMQGFAGTLSAQNLSRLQADPRVKYIERDSRVLLRTTQTNATWGLDRIDQPALPLSGSFTYEQTGMGVTAYIIDTGINTAHTNFGGRAVWGTNTTGDGVNSDCQGHGTHVAGTVGSATWGVAKNVKLVAVKVLNCEGSGTTSGVIAGLNWAAQQRSGPAVANMSLGGGASQALDDAVASATNSGLTVVVAAGNSNVDACGSSPARAPSAVTVGSTTSTDARSSFSNYGSCLDLFAPGSNITSTWIGSTTATSASSGTSMASPHVAGAAALILQANPAYTPAQVSNALIANSASGKVTSAGTGSPNRLLQVSAPAAVSPTPSGTTYTGSVSKGTSSFKPGTSGFTYAGGTLKATLSAGSLTDFDLYLQKKTSSGSWMDVAASTGSTSSESITYAAGSGTYRWEVYAYWGSGSYTLTETR